MNWNAFELINNAIDKTKKRLFPIRFFEWFKLMIIFLLAGNSKSFGSGFNYSGGNNSLGKLGTGSGNISENIRSFIKNYWIIGAIIFFVIFIIGTIWSYITSVFSFILIESLINKESKFTFRKNRSKGISLFLFKFFISIASLIIMGLLVFPYIYSFMKGLPIISTVGILYIIFSILILIIFWIVMFIIFLFLYDFIVPFMYVKEVPTGFAFSQIWKKIKENKKETFIYWIARLVLGIGIGIIALVVILVVLVVGVIIGGLIFLIGLILFKIFGLLTLWIILGIIVGIALIIATILLFSLVILPLSVFSKYFSLLNFEKLTGLKILKN